MYNVYLGNVKYVANIIFDKTAKCKSNRSADYEILGGIHSPNFIQMGPRKFNAVAFWKAHDLVNFFFYYSLPIFKELHNRELIQTLRSTQMS